MRSSNKPIDGVAARRAVGEIQSAVHRAIDGMAGTCVLAVSGGSDSMVLLHAAAATCPLGRLLVATFDHGTGSAAAEAVQRVLNQSAALGVDCVVGHAKTVGTTEAEWRRGRWEFLTGIAKRYHGTVATGHTRDDQIETVFIRALRDAGPRGLSALYAPSPVSRPLLDISRDTVRLYAHKCDVTFMEDPSNTDRRHLRNRVRLDLLPAIAIVNPDFGDDLLNVARQAAELRVQIDQIAATFTMMLDSTGSYQFPRAQFAGYSTDALRMVWPALAARAGVIMDWRGTHRLASFTIGGETGQSIQLSGGVDVRMRRNAIVFHRGVQGV